jgi:hypothetical protein
MCGRVRYHAVIPWISGRYIHFSIYGFVFSIFQRGPVPFRECMLHSFIIHLSASSLSRRQVNKSTVDMQELSMWSTSRILISVCPCAQREIEHILKLISVETALVLCQFSKIKLLFQPCYSIHIDIACRNVRYAECFEADIKDNIVV